MPSKMYLLLRRPEAAARSAVSKDAESRRGGRTVLGGLSAQRFQLINEAGDHAEALRPEGRVGGIEAERRQQLAVAQGATCPQQLQVAFGETAMRVLVG